MAHLEVRTFIAAPPEAVWEILADLEHRLLAAKELGKLDPRHPLDCAKRLLLAGAGRLCG